MISSLRDPQPTGWKGGLAVVKSLLALATFSAAWLIIVPVRAADKSTVLATGSGLAARYPDDRGIERVTVGTEPFGEYGKYPPPGAWFFYAYWHEMKGSADGKYWGNGLRPAQPQLVPKDTWQCVELMLQLNSAPEKHDGELALW